MILQEIGKRIIDSENDIINHTTDINTIKNTTLPAIESQLEERTTRIKDIGLNAKDFGAIGDGVSRPISTLFATLTEAKVVYPNATALTDELDSCAIQRAIDTIVLTTYSNGIPNNGNIVYIPKGMYRLNKTIYMKSGVELRGAGRNAVRLEWGGVGQYGIAFVGIPTDTGFITQPNINNLSFHNVNMGLFVCGVSAGRFENLLFFGCTNVGLQVDSVVSNYFNNIHIENCGVGLGVRAESNQSSSTTQYFRNIHVAHCTGDGVSLGGSKALLGCTFENLISEYNGGKGILVGLNVANLSLKNVWLEGNTNTGLYSSGSKLLFENIISTNGITVFTGDNIIFKNIDANIITQTGVGNCYFEGYRIGTLTQDNTNKNVYPSNAMYKKFNATTGVNSLSLAYQYIKDTTAGTPKGIFLVTVRDTVAKTFCTAIYDYENGVRCTKTVLGGTLVLTTSISGDIYTTPIVTTIEVTIDLLSAK